MFKNTTDRYTVRIKVFIRNTWDWTEVKLRKSDMDYIAKYCPLRKACVPTLRRRGKNWSLDFPFEEERKLTDTPIREQTIVSVDLGINNACVCSVMTSEGTCNVQENPWVKSRLSVGKSKAPWHSSAIKI